MSKLKRKSIQINDVEFRHYIEDYWIDDTGNLSKIKFNEEKFLNEYKETFEYVYHKGSEEIKTNFNYKIIEDDVLCLYKVVEIQSKFIQKGK